MKQTKQFLRPLLMAIVMMVGMLVPQGAWAQSPVTVDGQGFQTIQEAIEEIVWGGRYDATLTLHQDLTLGDVEYIDISFVNDSEYFNITIDLNGHAITGGCDWEANSIGFANHGVGLPTVTIANSCQDKKGKLFNCRLDLMQNTKVIVNEGVSIYPSFELIYSEPCVVSINSETSSVENYGDIYGGVMVSPGGSFINNGSVAYVNGEFENNGDYCAYFNWADDGSSFSAFVNGGVYDYIEGDEDYSITSEVTKEPTCTEPGVRTVTGTCWGFTDTKEVEIPAGHDHQVQNVVWSEDYTSATLQLVCSRDAEHTANVEVTGEGITSEDTTPATCTTAGVRTYTAKATYEGVEYTGTKEVEISATGHAYHVLLDENSNPVFVWSEDYTTATLQVVCSHDAEHTAGVEVTLGEGITWVDTPATCTAVGVRTYTATATYEGETYTGTAIEAIEPIAEHTLDEHNVCTECGHGFIFFEKERSYDIEPNNRYAFSNSEGSVEYIGNTTFNEWMYAFEFSGLVTEIGDRAFTSREPLTAIYLPEVTTIGEDAFNGCGLRDNVSLPKATTIGQAAFLGCGFQTLSLPEATTIGYMAFGSCGNLSSIELPKATTIGDYAFEDCSNLNSITVACAADLSGAEIREEATITRVHDFSSKTLTEEPVEDGLYAYVCDLGCDAHSDDHIVKASEAGEGESATTIELAADGEGNFSAPSVDVADGKTFSTPVEFTVPSDQVTVERTFTAEKPASVMLPFSVPATKINGATFYEFGGVSYDTSKQQWVATMKTVDNVVAYKPYLVIPTGTSITFGTSSESVTFLATSEASNNMTQTDDGTG